MLQKIFITVLEMSLVASLVIPVVLLMRLLLKKLPKIISYGLWAVVLFRLLCPFSVTAVFSLIPDDISNGEIVERAIDDYVGGIAFYYDRTEEYYTAVEAGRQPISTGSSYYVVTGPDGISEPATIENTWIPVLSAVWLVGITVLAGYSIGSFFTLKRKLTGTVRLRDNIYLADSVSCPFVLGVFRPKIYLPSSLTEQEQSYIILHEKHHIHRGDHVIKILAFLALCIHWFNPLVWLAFVLAGKDMEMSCDEAVIRQMGEDIRGDYAASLLSLATGRRFISGTPLAFGEGDVKDRIYNLAHQQKPTVVLTVAAVVICLVAAICLMTDPNGKSQESSVSGEESTENNAGTFRETEFVELFESSVEETLEGFTSAQSDAIRTELRTRIVYEKPDEYGISVWLDEAASENRLVTLHLHSDFRLEDYAFVKLDVDSIDPLVMDGIRWLHVTGKAVFEQNDTLCYYKRSLLDIMIPVTVNADETVTLGKFYASTKGISPNSDMEGLLEMGYEAAQLHVEKADITHDGVEDYIVTDMYFPPEAAVTGENLDEMVQQYILSGPGYVSIYDGTGVKGEDLGTPLWVMEFSAAHAGNGQLSIVYRDGLAYLLHSSLWQGQGAVGYDFDVLALDRQGNEYVIAEGATEFYTNEIPYLDEAVPDREEQKEKIMEFKEHITPWFEDAVLIVAAEVGFEEQLITTERNRYVPEDYYDTRWAQWED